MEDHVWCHLSSFARFEDHVAGLEVAEPFLLSEDPIRLRFLDPVLV